MLRHLLSAVAIVLSAAVVFVCAGLLWAHIDIRGIDPALPTVADVVGVDPGADLPVRITWLNTASQGMPRATVLDPGFDPDPEARYVMAHSSFLLEWEDGRSFLIDAGMDRESALEFGEPLELAGAEPIRPLTPVAEQLGEGHERVGAIGFTHLHPDHTAGLRRLCRTRGPVRLVQAPLQAERDNYTTLASREHLESARCARPETLSGGPRYPVTGFPGLFVVEAGGHTPGSQLFVAHVRDGDEIRVYVVTGDVVNQVDGALADVPKPWLYSLIVVPEAPERLGRLRRFLGELAREHEVRLLVSHDQLQLEAAGLAVPAPGGASGS